MILFVNYKAATSEACRWRGCGRLEWTSNRHILDQSVAGSEAAVKVSCRADRCLGRGSLCSGKWNGSGKAALSRWVLKVLVPMNNQEYQSEHLSVTKISCIYLYVFSENIRSC